MIVKFNTLQVKFLDPPKTKDGVYFSQAYCDLCSKQGITLECIAYTGKWDTDITKFNTTYSHWLKLDIQEKDYATQRYSPIFGTKSLGKSMLYYLCSEECVNMLSLQLGDSNDVVPHM